MPDTAAGHVAVAAYVHFAVVASHQVAVIVSLVTGHVATLSVKVKVGPVVSLMMIYVFEFVGHPQTSLILIMTLVVHSFGVNANERPVELLVQLLHPFVEYATAVFGDGVAVSFIVHCVLHA